MRKSKKIKFKSIVLVLMIICATIFVYSGLKILSWYSSNKKNEKLNEELHEVIKVEEIEEELDKYKIDWQNLKNQNPDTVAYLKVNNTNIDYIVVQHSDNSYYLKHNFNRERNVSGWIFSDYHNKFDGTDKNIAIFGHNTRDGSMFGTLKNILNKDWYENKENHKVVLVTEMGTYYYQVFSTYSIIPEDYYINTKFNNDSEFDKFVKKLKSRSVYDYGVEVSKDDRILTLSSCIGDGKKRVVLHAKLIKDSQ